MACRSCPDTHPPSFSENIGVSDASHCPPVGTTHSPDSKSGSLQSGCPTSCAGGPHGKRSNHGVRVVSGNPWKRNERLNLWSLPGDFRARARVVYCEPLGHHSFAIGLQLLASAGEWK